MTKREREKLRHAIDMLMADPDDFTEAMLILCELASVHWPHGEALKNPTGAVIDAFTGRVIRPASPKDTTGEASDDRE